MPGARRPLIGVTTYHRERDGRPRFTLPDAYVEAVRAAGGMPVLLPPGEDEAAELLARLDGLVLSGGGDLDPARFGGGSHPSVYYVSPERDAFEVELVRGALARELPTLAICRGAQVLNVALGGDVHLHLEDVVGRRVLHRASQDAHVHHTVELETGSRLSALFGRAGPGAVPSWHHQAVNRLGRGLRAVAWAPDGTIEALELEGAPLLCAVQWHPELEAGPGSPQGGLFRALVADAARRGSGPP